MQQGNATWLIAALELAQGNRDAAADGFHEAAQLFDTPEMKLMAEGYVAIASRSDGLPAVFAGLEALGSEDSVAFCEQLAVAHAIFATKP